MYMKSYGIHFSPSDLFHLALYLQGPSILLQMARYCSFSWLSSIPLYTGASSLSIHLSMDTHLFLYLGCFVDNAAMNTGVQISFQIGVSVSSRHLNTQKWNHMVVELIFLP